MNYLFAVNGLMCHTLIHCEFKWLDLYSTSVRTSSYSEHVQPTRSSWNSCYNQSTLWMPSGHAVNPLWTLCITTDTAIPLTRQTHNTNLQLKLLQVTQHQIGICQFFSLTHNIKVKLWWRSWCSRFLCLWNNDRPILQDSVRHYNFWVVLITQNWRHGGSLNLSSSFLSVSQVLLSTNQHMYST